MKPNTVGRTGGQDPATGQVRAPHGFAAGTILYTQDGELPVEHLAPGDAIISRDAGLVRLRGLARRVVLAPAVRLRAGSLGHTRPVRDVILPAGQALLVRDWRARALFGQDQAVVPVARLIDGEFVAALGLRRMVLFTLRFQRPHIVYADGLEAAAGAPAPAPAP